MNNNLKLVVVVVSATNLMAKDGQGTSSSFVELHLDNQKFRTSVKDKDLNPVWNETFHFNISNHNLLPELQLEAYVYNTTTALANSRSFLGKVRIAGTSFVPFPDAVVMHYPLEKRSIFSRVKGELSLKVFLTNNNHNNVRISSPPSTTTTPGRSTYPSPAHHIHHNQVPISNTSRSIPNDSYEQQQQRQHQQHRQQQQQDFYMVGEPRTPPPPLPRYTVDETKSNHSFLNPSSYDSHKPVDYYAPKETSPFIGGGRVVGGRVIPAGAAHQRKTFGAHDLVETMQYLFVRVVKARDLPTMDVTGSLDPYVEVKIGNYKGKTRVFDKEKYPEWNEVFAFSMESIPPNIVEICVKDKDLIVDDFVGIVRIDLADVPFRVPPDSPLAPEWYRLADKEGKKGVKGELMLAVWIGTQADESFPDSWHSDAATSSSSSSLMDGSFIHSKVYHSPRLWYVRVNIIEVRDLVQGNGAGGGEHGRMLGNVFARAQIGHQILGTRTVQSVTSNALWNEEFMFVAAEPFEDHLNITVQDRVGNNKDELIGSVVIPLQTMDKRIDYQIVPSRWLDLEKSSSSSVDFVDDGKSMNKNRDRFSSRIHLRFYLEGGYHVFDQSTHYSSDLRPTAKQLWKFPVGVLELGILNAGGLLPMKQREGRGTSDTYCVAKYGQKWVRTRTIVDSLTPKYNEQYSWEVFDPATVLTVGVFDNHQIIGHKKSDDDHHDNNQKDTKIGKVRIRLSTLQTGRVYTHSYPLLVLHPSGVKNMGELHLAIRFSSSSLVNMLQIYSRPLLPKMHYIQPLSLTQLDFLKQQAVKIVAAKLSRMEPPLRKEVVEYMSDSDSHLWSMRKSKANFFRLMSIFSSFIAFGKWFGRVCVWANPITTVLVHVLLLIFVCFPELILPSAFMYMFLMGIWTYRFRPMFPPHMNVQISQADNVHPDELAEEFDTFPTSSSEEQVKRRYDKLRTVAGRIQRLVGDVATQAERIQGLVSWRDPRATMLFMLFCLVAALVLYFTPMQLVVLANGFYVMRHPRLRGRTPPLPLNFFRRLPARTDSML